MADKPSYTAPVVRELGSVGEVTERVNKIGSAADQFTPVTGVEGTETQR